MNPNDRVYVAFLILMVTPFAPVGVNYLLQLHQQWLEGTPSMFRKRAR